MTATCVCAQLVGAGAEGDSPQRGEVGSLYKGLVCREVVNALLIHISIIMEVGYFGHNFIQRLSSI